MPTNNPQSTSLKLLADDGVVHVIFQMALTPDRYVDLIKATAQATTVGSLDSVVRDVGRAWGVLTVTQVATRT